MANIKGTKKRDILAGTAGADSISGLAGNDDLRGRSGADALRGGAGTDRLWGDGGNDHLFGDAGRDTLRGGTGHDSLYGGEGNDKLFGESGNDLLDGGNGNDTLVGGAGNDTLLSSAGADVMNGGTGTDTADYSKVTDPNGIALTLDNSSAASKGAAGDTFSSIEIVIGTSQHDDIRGDAGANTLYGGGHYDSLYGGSGADHLYGGDGHDILIPGDDTDADLVDGGDGEDAVSYFGSSAGVTVDLEFGTTGGGAVNDVLTSIEIIYGSSHDDTLTIFNGGFAYGDAGDDTLSGSTNAANGPFNNTLEHLSGGSGADKFLIHRNTGLDYIDDFVPGAVFGPAGDTLIINSSEFAGIQYEPDGTGASTAIRNITAGTPIAADRASPQFIFDMGSSFLYFDADGNNPAFSPEPVADLAIYHGALTHGGALFSVDEYVIV